MYMYTCFILVDNERDNKTKWASSLVGKNISHVYLVHKKKKTYKGRVLKFDTKTSTFEIKYDGYSDITCDALDELYEDLVNGDLIVL